MNTADRSIAPIDTALRRRFVFEEMAPNPSLLTKEKTPDIYDGIDLKELLEAINTRIEYLYDRDHTIGHAYLIDVKDLDDLKFAFKNKIIPLLAEYFYEDWKNIDLVLNKNEFIKTKNDNNSYLTVVKKEISGKVVYKVSDEEGWTIENFKKIYNGENEIDKTEESTSQEKTESKNEG
jgi:5-methylcytosine-specific restriction enzyme B